MDIYTPKDDDDQNRRVLFLVHGGGFREGNDKRQRYIVEFAHWFGPGAAMWWFPRIIRSTPRT